MTIPADIFEKAHELALDMREYVEGDFTADYPGISFNFGAMAEDIARAIMEERERCAQIATSHGNGRAQQSKLAKKERLRVEARDFESMAMQAYQIASAIRNEGARE